MHYSRMRTARLLPVSPSMHCSRGVCSWGVSAPGGVCSRGCLLQGVSAPRGFVCPDTPPIMDRILDTHFWKYYLALTSLRALYIKGVQPNMNIGHHVTFMHTRKPIQHSGGYFICAPKGINLCLKKCRYFRAKCSVAKTSKSGTQKIEIPRNDWFFTWKPSGLCGTSDRPAVQLQD